MGALSHAMWRCLLKHKEVPDLQQTTQQQQTNADAGDARPRKFRRLDLTSMPAGEVIDLD